MHCKLISQVPPDAEKMARDRATRTSSGSNWDVFKERRAAKSSANSRQRLARTWITWKAKAIRAEEGK